MSNVVQRVLATVGPVVPLRSNTLFNLYIVFVITHFLRLSSRVPAIGALRITLLMVAVITIGLLANRADIRGRLEAKPARWLVILAAYIVITLPFVRWPGSVLQVTGEAWIRSIVFFFFTALIVDSEQRLRVFLNVFLWCQILRVLEPLYLHVTEGYWGSKTYIGDGEFMARLGGGPHDTVNPNGLGFVIVSVIPFIYYLWIIRRGTSFVARACGLAVMALLLYALILTSSRSSMLALLMIIILIFVRAPKKLMFGVAVVFTLILTYANLTDLQRDRYMSLFSSDSRSAATAEGRVEGIKNEIDLAMDRPIFGHGLGTSGEAKYHRYGRFQVAHDLYTELVIDLGIFGLVIFLAFIRSSLKSVRELRDTSSEGRGSHVVGDYLSSLNDAIQVWALMCLFISIAYFGLMEWHWYWMAGVAVAATQIYRSGAKSTTVDSGSEAVPRSYYKNVGRRAV